MRPLLFWISFFVLMMAGAMVCEGENNKSTEKTNCHYADLKVNEETGTSVKKMEWELLLNHIGTQTTNSGKPKIDDSFAAYAHLVNYNNSIILYLRMEILSTEARKNYGHIYAGDKLLFKLGNDEVVSLESGKSEIGNLRGAMTSYSVYFQVADEVASKLSEEKIVKVRIHWSKGYMDYTVSNEDFFIRQLACVE